MCSAETQGRRGNKGFSCDTSAPLEQRSLLEFIEMFCSHLDSPARKLIPISISLARPDLTPNGHKINVLELEIMIRLLEPVP